MLLRLKGVSKEKIHFLVLKLKHFWLTSSFISSLQDTNNIVLLKLIGVLGINDKF